MRAARILTLMITPLLLASCHKEKSFDERYAAASKSIGASAAAIDAEIASRESEAVPATGAASGPASRTPR